MPSDTIEVETPLLTTEPTHLKEITHAQTDRSHQLPLVLFSALRSLIFLVATLKYKLIRGRKLLLIMTGNLSGFTHKNLFYIFYLHDGRFRGE